MSINLSSKYYQENKENYKRKLSKEEKKSDNVVANVTKIFQKIKKIKLIVYRKKIL